MPNIRFEGNNYACKAGETVLDAFLRLGVSIPFSCRSGICHACIHRVVSGQVPADAQKGLNEVQRAAGHFLPCRCRPVSDIEIASVKSRDRSAARLSTPGPTLPDPELWSALGAGQLLNQVLEDFYTRVYADARLSGFFKDVTKQRSVEKQFLFLRQLFTGEKVYFGDRPRNAHHWMVISDELFDYRAELMTSCLRRAGLPEALVGRWMAIEETFRSEIVKSAPISREMDGVPLPLEGYGEAVLEVGTVCDGCSGEIVAGTPVRYHVRLGNTYCPECHRNGILR